MKCAIITAMPQEFRAASDGLGAGTVERFSGFRARRATTGGHQFLLLESGMGFANATRAARTLISLEPPDLIISAGFCGGIDPGLQVGDCVVASALLTTSENGLHQVAVTIPAAMQSFAALHAVDGVRICPGSFVSTAEVMSKQRLAGLLQKDWPCPAVEMESAAIANVASESGIALFAIRTVSDPADEELDFTLDELCDSELRIRIHKVLLTILRKPRIIPQLIRLAANSRTAGQSLTTALERLIPLL